MENPIQSLNCIYNIQFMKNPSNSEFSRFKLNFVCMKSVYNLTTEGYVTRAWHWELSAREWALFCYLNTETHRSCILTAHAQCGSTGRWERSDTGRRSQSRASPVVAFQPSQLLLLIRTRVYYSLQFKFLRRCRPSRQMTDGSLLDTGFDKLMS